ncbi:hypothetical protein DC522_33000 [Microvirga sp. KLBC 81]|nr:hypothetical protein DC522_33000 [Microvirga sp. KLBC 81]
MTALVTTEGATPTEPSFDLDEEEASMRRAEVWAAFNALAVVITIVAIAALFHPLCARAEEGHSDEHQMAHGTYHHLYNGIMRPDVKNSSCCSEQDCAPTEAKWDSVRKRWTALKYGQWVNIPPSKIVPRDQVPDGLGAEPHLCAPPPSSSAFGKDEVFCFIEPNGGT